MESDREIKNLIKVCLSVAASLSYCHFVSSKIPRGKFRLLSLLPVIFLFTFLPLLFSYLFPTAIATLFLSWLGNFKLLLFAFDQGPLSSLSSNDPPGSLLQFICITCLPVKIKHSKIHLSSSGQPQVPPQQGLSSSKPPKLPLNWPTKVLLFAISVGVHDFKDHVHPKMVLGLYCCMVYLLVDIVFGIASAVVHVVLGMELEPPSDEPYFSTSLQDFWGRRWNLMVTNLLRHTVYKPVRFFLGPTLGQWAPLPAVLASFLVSGLMHELLFWYVTRASPTWEATWFFVLHGACVVAEFGLKRLLTGRCRLHWALSAPLTVGFVVATAIWLFLPPLVRSGATDNAIEECKMMLHFAKEGLNLQSKILS